MLRRPPDSIHIQTTIVAMTSSCPYNSLPTRVSNIWVADATLCPPTVGRDGCVVDRNCSLANTTSYQAIGKCSDLKTTVWSHEYLMFIQAADGVGYMTMDMATLPDRVSYMYVLLTFDSYRFLWTHSWCGFSEFNGVTHLEIPTSFQWPANLTTLHFTDNELSSLPPMPPTLTSLHLTGNEFSDPLDFTVLPRSITDLEVINNDYTQIANVDWTNMTSLKFDGIKTITNVTFSSKLTYLYLYSSSITSWVMDSQTYNVLNQLDPIEYPGHATAGFDYLNLTITTSKSACDKVGGNLDEIWTNRGIRMMADGSIEAIKPFTVCVIGASKTMTAGTAGYIVWFVMMALISAGIVFLVRRHGGSKPISTEQRGLDAKLTAVM
ncbi:Aste57867_15019 [Aphanomyces stellatus]|uniref:Aste57867_15019 protein n=1 Tax=Aphanomyces stellatus TaxID=120398 RepID=A0A485L313_9STRA|nr:hypothetical protein As57867_014963 [Aphanomyces stellatus]VFT91833.1 Aste57867_15019 [Aphanomyces stellatus]